MTTATTKDLLQQLQQVKDQEVQAKRKFLDESFEIMAHGGVIFQQIVEIETAAAKEPSKVTASSVFDKHAKGGKLCGFAKTVVTSTMLHLARFHEHPQLQSKLLKDYRTVGIKGKHNADGTMPERVDYLAQLASAQESKRWSAKTGNVKASPKGGKRKTKAQQVAEKAEVIDELVKEWGEGFDLRYFGDDDLKQLEAAIRAEHARRKLGGEVLV